MRVKRRIPSPVIVSALVVATILLWGAPAPAIYQLCPLSTGPAYAGDFVPGSFIRITGTMYDAAGNATKVICDTRAGDAIQVCAGCANVGCLVPDIYPQSAECTLDPGMLGRFVGSGPTGAEVQVVKNGVPKRECLLHAGVEGVNYPDDWPSSYTLDTRRKFDSAGHPTIEKGSIAINTAETGQIFIGKILIRYP